MWLDLVVNERKLLKGRRELEPNGGGKRSKNEPGLVRVAIVGSTSVLGQMQEKYPCCPLPVTQMNIEQVTNSRNRWDRIEIPIESEPRF